MAWNTSLFLVLNASTVPSPAMLVLATALAALPMLLAPVVLTGLWVWGAPGRRPALLAVAAGLFVGQGLNLLAGMMWFGPRPFMAGIGRTWMEHAADNGFPSDHATLAWSLGLGLVLTGASRTTGIAACLAGVAAGWARVFLGVHFPLDVLASPVIGLAAALMARVATPVISRWLSPPIEHLYEAVLEHLPSSLPLPRRTGL